MTTLAEQFNLIFAGLPRAHGTYVVPLDAKPNGKGKVEGKAQTVREDVTVEKWEKHLSGESPIGIIPIRDDATCMFGAIDIDVYPLDHAALAAKIKKFELPLMMIRSKSGGAHLYLFCSEPIEARHVRFKLSEFAILLGWPKAEIFPKQARLAGPTDLGSWINIPYAGGRKSSRYAFRADMSAMPPTEFVEAVEKAAITGQALEEFVTPTDGAHAPLLEDGPPCLSIICKDGVSEQRNIVSFNYGVYLRKRYGEDWESYVEAFNQAAMKPPLGHGEIANTVKSVNKKNYNYQCTQEPLASHCNRAVCLKRKFGVGGGNEEHNVMYGRLEKFRTDPPLYIWEVNGARIELRWDQISKQQVFRDTITQTIDIVPKKVTPGAWERHITAAVATLVAYDVPIDATREGQFWEYVRQFCTGRATGSSLDEIKMNKPVTTGGRTYFHATDLIQYLRQHRFESASERDVWAWLRRREAQHHSSRIKGVFMNYWSIPAFDVQTEAYDVPRKPQPEL